MTSRISNKPGCSMCGICCLKLGLEIRMTPGDYRRWKRQGRDDILRYAYIPTDSGSWGYLWFDPETRLELDRCPYLTENSSGKCTCAIQDTKPKVCKQFWCEWAYGLGARAVPFRVAAGWTEKARQLGYGKSRKKRS